MTAVLNALRWDVIIQARNGFYWASAFLIVVISALLLSVPETARANSALWVPAVLVTQPEVGPQTLRHLEAVMAILLGAGFSLEMAHHALHVLGSRILGFTQDPFNDSADVRPEPEAAARLAQAMAVNYPSLGALAMAASHDGALGGCDDDFEFAFGLDLILDGLDRLRETS